MDDVLACDRAELWVDPAEGEQRVLVAEEAHDSPLFQALVSFIPTGRLAT
jgi:hypothetical protein